MTNILIIEDEPLAQQELQRLLGQTGMDFTVLACLETIEESVEWLTGNPAPDLVLLDIQLADGLSFEIFRQVELKSPVIFTTAYDAYAIKAFELNSIDYLLKPVKLDQLKASLEKLQGMKNQFSGKTTGLTEEMLERMLSAVSAKTYKSRFLVKLGDQMKSIGHDETAFFKAEDNVVFLYTTSAKKFIIEHTLEQLEDRVDPGKFFRVNRSFLIGLTSIKKVSKYFNSRLALEIEPDPEEQVLVSRKRVQDFMQWLDQ